VVAALPSDCRRFFQAAGANFMVGRMSASLTPGANFRSAEALTRNKCLLYPPPIFRAWAHRALHTQTARDAQICFLPDDNELAGSDNVRECLVQITTQPD
jgi:hypothetical protein